MNDLHNFQVPAPNDATPTFKGDDSALPPGQASAATGYVDCHLHLVWYGTQRLRQVDLTGSTTLSQALDRLREGLNRRPTGPLIGFGLNDELLAERRLVSREELDALSAGRPVVVQRICGHVAVGNGAAIRSLGTAAGGDQTTGRYEESAAMRLLSAVGGSGPGAAGKFDIDLAEAAILEGCQVLLRQGITAVGTMLDTLEEFAAYERLRARGALPVRVSVMPPMRDLEEVSRRGIRQGDGDDRLWWGPMKMFADGTLGARTALLSADYADAPGSRGTAVTSRHEMVARAEKAATLGFGVVIHAIGDLALDHALDAVEAGQRLDATGGLLNRIEHVAVARDDQITRMARSGVCAGIQPQFVTSDTWVPARLGERTRWAYRFGDMASAGVVMGLSSDAPIEPIDSAGCLAAAVNGTAWRDAGQNFSVAQARRAYQEVSGRLIGIIGRCK